MSYFLRTFAVTNLNTAIMEKNKTWFNRNFTLSLNGKYAGLDRVDNLSLFWHKLNKILTTSSRYGSIKRMNDSFSFKCSGQTVKLYYR